MPSTVAVSMFAAAVLLAATPRTASAEWQPTSRFASTTVTRGGFRPLPNHERRAVIIAGVRQGALVGMLTGAVAGVVHARLRDDSYGAAFTVLGWTVGGMLAGGSAGGIRAARRYHVRDRQPSGGAMSLTGGPRGFRPPSACLHPTRSRFSRARRVS